MGDTVYYPPPPDINLISLRRREFKAIIPARWYKGDAGYDLYCMQTKIIWPFSAVDIDTGWDIKIPGGHWGTIKPRSSTFKRRRLVIFEGVLGQGLVVKFLGMTAGPIV